MISFNKINTIFSSDKQLFSNRFDIYFEKDNLDDIHIF